MKERDGRERERESERGCGWVCICIGSPEMGLIIGAD